VPFRIWDLARKPDLNAWLDCWSRWATADVFAHPGYVGLFGDSSSRPMCAAWEGTEGAILLPFLLRDLRHEPYCPRSEGAITDISSPYGYGGPFILGSGEQRAAEFWSDYTDWARTNGVVSEFVRMSLSPDARSRYPGEIFLRQSNIVRTLQPSHDHLWSDFEHKVRKNIKHARRSGIEIQVELDGRRHAEFAEVYESTMNRRSAAPGYYFEPRFFDNLHRDLIGHFVYFFAVEGGRAVSCELVLTAGQTAYSFLGGTRSDAFPRRPNDLLKYTVIRWAKEHGLGEYVLGGGFRPGDGIFRYKRSFAPSGGVPFFTGRRVLDPERYDRLVQSRAEFERRLAGEWTPDGSFFPLYRSSTTAV
jgi:hypothetical protein